MVDAVRKALNDEIEHRRENPDTWIENERAAVAGEVNRWAMANGWPMITVDDIERIEHQAMGHIDYVRKLSLYASELVWP